jgi:hypothetical protein
LFGLGKPTSRYGASPKRASRFPRSVIFWRHGLVDALSDDELLFTSAPSQRRHYGHLFRVVSPCTLPVPRPPSLSPSVDCIQRQQTPRSAAAAAAHKHPSTHDRLDAPAPLLLPVASLASGLVALRLFPIAPSNTQTHCDCKTYVSADGRCPTHPRPPLLHPGTLHGLPLPHKRSPEEPNAAAFDLVCHVDARTHSLSGCSAPGACRRTALSRWYPAAHYPRLTTPWTAGDGRTS